MSENHKKRSAHAKNVTSALQQILNDTSVMPNADCSDLIVSVSKVVFGRTVREIYVDVFGEQKCSDEEALQLHQKYLEEAKGLGKDTYIDLTDMFCYPELTEIIAEELKVRLKLQYIPVIRPIEDLMSANV